MKYLEVVLNFLTTIARLFFRSKRKHKPDQPVADDPGNQPSQYGSGTGCYRSDTVTFREMFPPPERIMGGALIVCATGGYLLKLLG